MNIKKNVKDILRPTYYKLMQPKIDKMCKQTESRLQAYHNLYSGRRCFIIGNGPSLRIPDLESLSNEITFAFNRVYVLFENTKWRPTFYLCQDPTIYRSCHKEINTTVRCKEKFLKPTGEKKYNFPNAIFYNVDYRYSKKRIQPMFSNDVSNCIYDGRTVTYSAIQLAAYMGFNEIFLLGVDCYYSANNNHINENSYPDKKMYDSKKVGMPPDIAYNFVAFEAAKAYCINAGIKICNATRGGKLEVFERIDFDDIDV